jgi:glycosyltransferase involved in cell wall biosynthesis
MSAFKRLLSFAGFMVVSCFKAFFHKKPDIVFATSTPLTIGVPALVVSKLKRVPFVFEARDLWPEFAIDIGVLKNPILIKLATMLEKMCYRNAVQIFTISEGLRQRMIERGVPGEKIKMLPIGVDLESVNAISPDTSFREVHGLTGKFVMVYAGSHGPSNGLGIVVEAAKILKDHPDIVLVMIGEGKEKKNLIALKEEYGLENLLFIDAMPRNHLLGILKEVDAGLMITTNLIRSMPKCPNLPRKFFDYLACGLPVLVNVEGDMSEVIQKNEIGLVCGEADGKGLAENILTLYNQSDTRLRMAQNAAKLVQEYDLSRISYTFEENLLETFNKWKQNKS